MQIKRALLSSMLLLVAANSWAQTAPEGELKWGGYTAWPWVEPDPGHPGEFIYWAFADGPVMRRFETFSGTHSFEPVVYPTNIPWTPQTAHHVAIEPLPGGGAVDDAVGLAVGSDGLVLWTLSQFTNPLTWKPIDVGLTGAPDLWESFLLDQGNGEYVAWIAGDEQAAGTPTLRFSPDSIATWIDVLFVDQNNQLDPPPAGTDFKSLGFADPAQTGGRIIGAAGAEASNPGDPRIYYTRNGIRWLKASFNGPVDDELIIWDIEFLPVSSCGSPSMPCAVAVGGNVEGSGPGYFFVSTDGGATWDQTLECALSPNTCSDSTDNTLPSGVCTGSPPALGGTNNPDAAITVYGVTALSDGSALAVGYNGAIWKLPSLDETVLATGVWSGISDYDYMSRGPLWGIHGGALDRPVATGQWGVVWDVDPSGAAHGQVGDNETLRLHDIERSPGLNGSGIRRVWTVGLQGTIFASDDQGASWYRQHDYTSGYGVGSRLKDVEAATPDKLIAVGTPKLNSAGEYPLMLTTLDGGDTCWQDRTAELELAIGAPLELKILEDAAFHPITQEAWAIAIPANGSNSTVVIKSDSNLGAWSQVGATLSSFRAEAITVAVSGDAILVGRQGGQGAAYLWSPSAGTWAPIAVPSGTAILRDVDIKGSSLWAVGDQSTTLTYVGGAFIDAGLTFPELVDLRSIEIEDFASARHFLIGGDEGRMYHRTGTGPLETVRTNTTSDLEGLSLSSDGAAFFLGPNPRWGDSAILKADF